MSNESRDQLLSAIQKIVEPIVGFLLEAGVGFREFSRIAKSEFVRLASMEYGVRGRLTNISRVAVMTGLTRKEIKAIRQSFDSNRDSFVDVIEKLNPATVVLHAWYSDPAFLDSNGQPIRLFPAGEGKTFRQLCRKYAGDIPFGAMLSELRRAGSVEELKDGTLLPRTRYFTPIEFDERFVGSMAFSLGNLASTLMTNARYSRRSGSDELERLGLLERYVWSSRLSDSDVVEFKQLAEEKAGELLGELDAWIGEREQQKNSDLGTIGNTVQTEAGSFVGLGVYLFESGPRQKSG